ncbi:MAG TPA: tail fiber protein [Thermoanaerobaculia bacterium]|nr:tail fiber protein [Thermoanaerobaculia bacterium]
MASPFMGEIRLVSFNFAPQGWAMCNGQLLPINQNQALFSLLGTTFGGNGQTTFALPDLRGRAPIHVGSGHTLGEKAGEQAHTLTIAELPTHTHSALANSGNSTTPIPGGNLLGAANNLYAANTNLVALGPDMIANVGGSQAHQNMQPFIIVTYCIALQGLFPSQN